VLGDAQDGIDASSLGVWFEGVVAVDRNRGSLTISVPNPFAREYVETRFKPGLEASLRERLSPTASLRIIVGAGDHEADRAK
jgi:chromosomal replication initiation ATPase DnaA